MGKFAVIKNGIVDNIIIAENAEIAKDVTGEMCVEYFDDKPAVIGLKYDENGFEQIHVPTPEETLAAWKKNQNNK